MLGRGRKCESAWKDGRDPLVSDSHRVFVTHRKTSRLFEEMPVFVICDVLPSAALLRLRDGLVHGDLWHLVDRVRLVHAHRLHARKAKRRMRAHVSVRADGSFGGWGDRVLWQIFRSGICRAITHSSFPARSPRPARRDFG